MKEEWEVFIRSNKDRGDDVIKALTDLGAVNYWEYAGNCPDSIYYIRHDGYIGHFLYETESAKIIMNKYTELYLPEKWKNGDILIRKDGTDYKVFWEYDLFHITTFYAYNVSAVSIMDEKIISNKGYVRVCDRKDYRLATPSEIKHFHELLHKCGKDWDVKKRLLVNWKYKPKDGEDYYYIISNGIVHLSTWFDYKVDNSRFSIGNCFKTKEEAEIMAEKFIKLLKGKS